MVIALVVLICLFGGVAVFFKIPYSPAYATFMSFQTQFLKNAAENSGLFTQEEVSHLPAPVNKYFNYCGYIGTPKMGSMKATYKNVNFIFGKEKPAVRIDYTQCNTAYKPARMAYIDSAVHGVPFEGLDTYINGKGSMKGVLAKLFNLFSQTGKAMDQASLATFLSECLIMPSAALQDYITWEELDDLQAKAVISYCGITAGGIFRFNENGAALSFTTDDRAIIAADGTIKKAKWSAVFNDYQEKQGIKKPTTLQAIWHDDDGDLLYFDGKDVAIEYDPKQ
ncbi:MAG: DUF6544 family protein [Clostridiaceae bacterium]|nr:DUF6544 family protein [Clostridiaceae bacterium]